ncbi:WD40 repeat domain-containing serine/threonine protein kinase [Nocardiopsis changdeensis]|uniref:Serine/threonine protein kinase n=1 Tax=Nocardiopsis changdeensis TaxID=2831969 RepID=A0ABX8BIL1_9ACTN|nr:MULTISPECIES: serine/threonine-protein kinase [Nocardiopsis]QUX22051.1 serine/threonine protein kinase [Nocardiopsis changdeensis]QYX37989.1 serine/threonine protein kinase [Nocardiopsis sp. MT53]
MRPLEPSDPRRIGGYRLVARLGEGGMGQVYLARTASGRQVAVKVIRPGLVQDRDFRTRFAREVDAARRVGGFHTAQVVDADLESEPPWIATAYIPGPTLHQRVRDQGPVTPPDLHTLIVGLAEGLRAVHDCGLVHRDLKPGNVVLSGDGPRIIDFGIARPLDAESLTTREAVFGTLPYMSPEQTENSHVGPASDVFSLGSVLAYAATGINPFNADSMAATIRRLIGPPPDPGDIDPSTRALIADCWNHDPDRRPTPEAILARFGALAPRATDSPSGTARAVDDPEAPTRPPAPTLVAATEATAVMPDDLSPRAAPPAGPRWRRALTVAAALVAVTVAVTAGVVVLRGERGSEEPETVSEAPEPVTTLVGHEDEVNSLVFSPDGTTLVTSDTKFSVRLWDTGTWEETALLVDEDFSMGMGTPGVAFDSAGDTLATGQSSVRLWDTGTWEETAGFLDDEWVTSVALSRDGTALAVSDAVGHVWLWDTGTGEETALIDGPTDYMTSVAFSPDGDLLATATAEHTAGVFEDSDGGAVRLWDTGTGGEVAVLAANEASFQSVVFSPDGATLAACSGSIHLWDTGSWEETAALSGQECAMTVAFSADGAMLAAGDHEGTVRFWDTGTWEEAAAPPLRPQGEPSRMTTVAFSPDGATFATGHADGTVHLWEIG